MDSHGHSVAQAALGWLEPSMDPDRVLVRSGTVETDPTRYFLADERNGPPPPIAPSFSLTVLVSWF
jgi:hypothetical protein